MKGVKAPLAMAAVIALLSVALWRSAGDAAEARRECRRLREIQRVMDGRLSLYRVRDSLWAASAGTLALRREEIESRFASLAALVRDMGVKLRRIESLAQSAVESRYRIEAPAKDTVIGTRPAVAIEYSTPWITLEGIVDKGLFLGEITSRDTLTQIVHRIPHRFLFVRWGTKELRQEIVSSNPHSRITYSRHIMPVR